MKRGIIRVINILLDIEFKKIKRKTPNIFAQLEEIHYLCH